ncbi:serine/threonine-protein kinase [Streptomyces liangshanensis]|uniref:serine/threonine-protein kinase n=1 Tax=Streptomyces liangshanensis TaxID=2717324 RepID=UPI0036D81EFD
MSDQQPDRAKVFKPLDGDDPGHVGGYRLAAKLGAGGMGKVYLSYTPGGRALAIKVIRPDFAEDAEFRRRFAQEVKSAQRVQGLFTAPVIDADTDGAQPWLATAYVPGPSLAEAVQEHGALPVDAVLLLVAGVAEALHVIHGAKIVHRDLKPSNVLLAADGPRVIDFGIAHAADATSLTGSGVTIGTPSFMAPEQAAGRPVTAATDIFALGQVAAYASTGSPAFGEGTSHGVLYRIVHEEPDLTGVPERLTELVTRCLAKDPEARPSIPEIIAICQAANDGTVLRRPEDWLPGSVAADITVRAAAPAPAPTPPPGVAAAPTVTAGPSAPAAPHPAYSPTQRATPAPGFGPATPPPGYGPRTPPPGYGPATPPPGHGPGTPPPGYGPTAAQHGPGYGPTGPQPYPGARPQPQPYPGPQPYVPPGPRKASSTKRVLGVVAGVFVALIVIGGISSALDDDKGTSKAGSGTSDRAGGTADPGGSGGSGGSEGKPSDTAPAPDPKAVSYKSVNLASYFKLSLSDDPVRPKESGDGELTNVGGGLMTNGAQLVLLKGSQPGTLETCRTDTRYTTYVEQEKLSRDSRLCLLTDAGDVALIKLVGFPDESDASSYLSMDLTVWRHAMDVAED